MIIHNHHLPSLGSVPAEWTTAAERLIDDYRQPFCACHLARPCGYHIISTLEGANWWERRYAVYAGIAYKVGEFNHDGLEPYAREFANIVPDWLREEWYLTADSMVNDWQNGNCRCLELDLYPYECGFCHMSQDYDIKDEPPYYEAFLWAAEIDGYNDNAYIRYVGSHYADDALTAAGLAD